MARSEYGYRGGDFIGAKVADPDATGGFVYAPTTATFNVYTTKTGSTQITDLQTVAGATITQVTPDATGRVYFKGPDPYTAELWLEDVAVPGSTRWLFEPTDMASRSVTGFIAASLVDAKGDIIAATANDTVARLAVGTDGQQLVAASAQATGLQWVTPNPAPLLAELIPLPADLDIDSEIIPGGFEFMADRTVDKVVVTVDFEPRGASATIVVVKRARATGTESTVGTITITQNTDKIGSITGLAASFLKGDRMYFRPTQVGSIQPGSVAKLKITDSTYTIPTALSAPGTVGSLAAVVSSNDVALSWTAPSGVHSGIDVWRDGAPLERLAKGTLAYTALGDATEAHTYTVRAFNDDKVSTGSNVTFTPASGISGVTWIDDDFVNASGTTNTLTVPVGMTIPVGDHVFISTGSPGTLDATIPVVTDSKSNTYAQDREDGQSSGTTDSQSHVLSSKLTTALVAGDQITVTYGTAHAKILSTALTAHGVKSATWKDKVAGQYSTTFTRNLDTLATAAQAAAGNLAVVSFLIQKQTAVSGQVSPAVGWSMLPLITTTAGSNDKSLVTMYQILSGTAAAQGTATAVDTGSRFAGSIVTYLKQ